MKRRDIQIINLKKVNRAMLMINRIILMTGQPSTVYRRALKEIECLQKQGKDFSLNSEYEKVNEHVFANLQKASMDKEWRDVYLP